MPPSEQQVLSWSKPVSTTEDQKCKNAISQISDALRSKFGQSVTIFLQGSYQNNTNVKRDSDVDIVLRHNGYYYSDLCKLNDQQKTIYNSKYIPGGYSFEQLKSDALSALKDVFGESATRCNKCIKITGNSYRVNADVVPGFVLKRLQDVERVEAEGIKFYADSGNEIISFPEQHYNNGVLKTNSTGRMYKRTVRILKVIKNNLIDGKLISEDLVSSFFIESLVYNVPNQNFITGEYLNTLRNVIIKIYNDMLILETANKYVEVSGLKWLFSGTRTPENAKQFMQKCWEYVGFN